MTDMTQRDRMAWDLFTEKANLDESLAAAQAAKQAYHYADIFIKEMEKQKPKPEGVNLCVKVGKLKGKYELWWTEELLKRKDNKIQAIKLVRQNFDVTLKSAKDCCDKFYATGKWEPPGAEWFNVVAALKEQEMK